MAVHMAAMIRGCDDRFDVTPQGIDVTPPGDAAPARITVRLSDVIWDTLYQPVARAVEYVAERLNQFQYLSIRHYLSFVFAALVGLLLVLAIWP